MKKLLNRNLLSGINALLFQFSFFESMKSELGTGNHFLFAYFGIVFVGMLSCLGINLVFFNRDANNPKEDNLRYSILSNLIAFGVVYVLIGVTAFYSLKDVGFADPFYSFYIFISYIGIIISIALYHVGKQLGTYVTFPYAFTISTSLMLMVVASFDNTILSVMINSIYSKLIANGLFVLLSITWGLLIKKALMNFITQYKALK